MRIAEPDVDLQAAGQFRVAGHFRPAIISHAFAERCRQPLHLPGEAVDIVSGDIMSGERRKPAALIAGNTNRNPDDPAPTRDKSCAPTGQEGRRSPADWCRAEPPPKSRHVPRC